jgi:hypothetical protein
MRHSAGLFLYIICMYVDPVLCRIALDHDPALCRIARDQDPVLCGIAQDQNGIARDHWIELWSHIVRLKGTFYQKFVHR